MSEQAILVCIAISLTLFSWALMMAIGTAYDMRDAAKKEAHEQAALAEAMSALAEGRRLAMEEHLTLIRRQSNQMEKLDQEIVRLRVLTSSPVTKQRYLQLNAA